MKHACLHQTRKVIPPQPLSLGKCINLRRVQCSNSIFILNAVVCYFPIVRHNTMFILNTAWFYTWKCRTEECNYFCNHNILVKFNDQKHYQLSDFPAISIQCHYHHQTQWKQSMEKPKSLYQTATTKQLITIWIVTLWWWPTLTVKIRTAQATKIQIIEIGRMRSL